jgi:leucyl aminopeptidase (aminopeptidase T)
VRIGTLPGVTEEMLIRLMNAELEEVRRRGWAVVTALNSGSEARITCRHGSDFRLGLEGRLGIVDAGELSNRGAFGNLPCGEGFIAPVEGPARARWSSTARSPASACSNAHLADRPRTVT